ncbi:hypothetical protein [Paenibacillus sp. IHBB 10380]|uniref:hypothetical protein n=1 Tax=Paenibacillus sp. IHBB 10380 TaxID=1566358 RepID=UPI001185FAAC|nr:hypothetical protein [Paenibacillus sp. IHBB 10380]
MEQDRIFIAGDSRTSIGIGGKKYALGECQKIIKIDDMVVFRSGSESITRLVLDEYLQTDNRSMKKLQLLTNKHVKLFDKNANIDLGDTLHAEFVIAKVEGTTPVIYNISSSNPDNITRIEGEKSTITMSMGVIGENTNKLVESLNGKLDNHALFKTVYETHSSETIGGRLTHYFLDKDQIIEYQSKIIDSRPIRYAKYENDAVQLDTTNGLVVTRSDNQTKAVFNATDGLKFQKNVNGNWVDKFYYDVNSGNLVMDGSIDAKEFKIGGVNALVGNRISVNSIEPLEVGRNVHMGRNAVIYWDQVPDKPYIPTLPSYIQNTRITSTSIESPNISGGVITGGKIIGGTIESGTTINVGTDITVGNNLHIGDPSGGNDKTIYFNSSAYISSGRYGYSDITVSSDVINMNGRTQYSGTVDFSSAIVVGLNLTAKFG